MAPSGKEALGGVAESVLQTDLLFSSYFSSNPPPKANTPTATPEASTAAAASAWGSPQRDVVGALQTAAAATATVSDLVEAPATAAASA